MITNHPNRLIRLPRQLLQALPLQARNKAAGLVSARLFASCVLAAAVLVLAQHSGWWPVALALVAGVELWPLRRAGGQARAAAARELILHILMGFSIVTIIAVTPRFVTQVSVAVLYAGWRVWWTERRKSAELGRELTNLLLVQLATFEALFLLAAVKRTSEWLILALIWTGTYAAVYSVLSRRGERVAALMAATWALIASEISWVLLMWLFVYTVNGGYLMVPQPALVLTALAYCFGSIYVSQREGRLSRARLTEYLLIGLILIAVVITGTSWKGGTL